jgi:hypothetical protein
MNLTLISKQVYEDNKRPGIKWKNIPSIDIRPSQQQCRDSIRGQILMRNLHQRLQNNETKEKLQCYHHMRMEDLHKFSLGLGYERKAEDIVRGIRMYRILSLDLSSSSLLEDIA